MDFGLKGRVAIVAAASKGLGRAAAAVRAGRGVELRRLHRRPRPGGRGRLRAVPG